MRGSAKLLLSVLAFLVQQQSVYAAPAPGEVGVPGGVNPEAAYVTVQGACEGFQKVAPAVGVIEARSPQGVVYARPGQRFKFTGIDKPVWLFRVDTSVSGPPTRIERDDQTLVLDREGVYAVDDPDTRCIGGLLTRV